MLKKLALPIAVTALILTGCGPEIQVPTRVCPGRSSTSQALLALRLRSADVMPIKASGRSLITYYVDGKKHTENLTAMLFVNPPIEIYFQGNATLIPKAIVGGSNKVEFWLSIRPKEVSTYWWGLWSQNERIEKLVLNPRIVLEAIGLAVLDGDADADWSLSNEGVFDVLTRRNSAGGVVRKIYIYSCDYLVRKIEYFDVFGRVEVVAELAQYKEVVEGFCVPRIIRIARRGETEEQDSVRVTLKSVKPYEFSQKQLEGLFNRPQPRSFKNVYEVVGGKWIEQPQ